MVNRVSRPKRIRSIRRSIRKHSAGHYNRWTPIETYALLNGWSLYKNSATPWKDILHHHNILLSKRNNINLKDRFRGITNDDIREYNTFKAKLEPVLRKARNFRCDTDDETHFFSETTTDEIETPKRQRGGGNLVWLTPPEIPGQEPGHPPPPIPIPPPIPPPPGSQPASPIPQQAPIPMQPPPNVPPINCPPPPAPRARKPPKPRPQTQQEQVWRKTMEEVFAKQQLAKKGGGVMAPKTIANRRNTMRKMLTMYNGLLATDPPEFVQVYTNDETYSWRQKHDDLVTLNATLRLVPDGQLLPASQKEPVFATLKSAIQHASRANPKLQAGLTDKEKRLWVPLPRIRNAIDEYTRRVMNDPLATFETIRNAVIARMYIVDNPPRRRQDFALLLTHAPLQPTRQPGSPMYQPPSWIDWNTQTVYLQPESDEGYAFTLTNETFALAVRMRDMAPARQYFFDPCTDDIIDVQAGEHRTRERFTRFTEQAFNAVIGRRLSSTLLRKIYITHDHMTGALQNPAYRENLARQMGHAVEMQQLFIVRDPPNPP